MAKGRLIWVLGACLTLGGCALVGFDEDDASDMDAGGGDGHDDKDSGSEDAGDVNSGRADASSAGDAGKDAAAEDAGRDSGLRDTGTDVEPGDDGGVDCPEEPYCEGDVYRACEAGKLVVKDCVARAGQCMRGSCESSVGCVTEHLDNGTACEDGRFCTVNDVCLDGVCVQGTARDCSDRNGPCQAGVCSNALAACTTTPINQGVLCGGELRCDEGVCSSGDLCALDGCNLACSADSSPCRLTCGNTLSCDFVCAPDTTCDVNCAGAGDACSVECQEGATCNVFCAEPSDCANVVCDATATCNLTCESGTCPSVTSP